MRRATSLGAAGVLALLLCAAGVEAGTISVSDTAGVDNYTRSLNGLFGRHKAESQAALAALGDSTAPGEQWYNPISGGQDNLWGSADRTGAQTQWAKSNLRLYDLYVGLGGNPVDLKQYFRHEGGRFYVGLENAGGRWFTSTDEAHGYLLKLLIKESAELPQAVRDAVDSLDTNALESVLAAARDAVVANRVFLPRGQVTRAVLTGKFDTGAGTPVVRGPLGVTGKVVAVNSATRITVDLSVAPGAQAGAGEILVFNAGTGFVPADSFDVIVTSGNGSLTADADGVGDTVATASVALQPGDSVDGAIEHSEDADLYAITATENGTLTVRSAGATDVLGQLETAAGQLLARNDDGGSWYNFVVSASVQAGTTYYLRVRHCCGATGEYSLAASNTAGGS